MDTRWSAYLAVAIGLGVACVGCGGHSAGGITLRFWAMGREGEVVQELARDFERENPGIRVIVQQIPWGAAHEKLITAHVGRAWPDVAQLGNTWVAEFVALRALEPLDPLLAASPRVRADDYFPGIWDTNVIDRAAYGVPWYVDTRLLFYRSDLLRRAGYARVPERWDEWRRSMEAIKRLGGKDHYAIFLPTNEYTPWIVVGLQAGSPLLKDDDTRGAFSDSAYRRAFTFCMGLFRDGLAPSVAGTAIANLYQEFGRGTFAMYITGPWNLGEFTRRLPPELQHAWAVAPLPGPDGPRTGLSVAGGSSLVIARESKHKAEAWKLVEFLSRPEQQLRFYRLTGDLPARRETWADTSLVADPSLRAFGEQLERAVPTPKVPEWEEISIRLQAAAELAVLGRANPDSVLASLDRDVDRILEKRRWLLRRGARHASLAGAR